MKFDLHYGNAEINFHIEDENVLGVLESENIPAIDDVSQVAKKALDRPIGTKAFSALFNTSDKVAIVVSDITRITGVEQILPVLISELHQADLPDKLPMLKLSRESGLPCLSCRCVCSHVCPFSPAKHRPKPRNDPELGSGIRHRACRCQALRLRLS